ncbi:MAG: hypothetical protein LQ337_008823 [Flavoplaca oasis]|nr:MAG: hypothetical protein LQ337_008823 [Flavoplaca oasis]
MADDGDVLALTRKINVWNLHDIPSMSVTRPFQAGLGTLSCLPPEMRSKIWQELFKPDQPTKSKNGISECSAMQPFASSDPTPQTIYKKRMISILLTSAQLYRETFLELYRQTTLIICFNRDHHNPNATAPHCGTTFYTHINGVCVARDFAKTDLSRFGSIKLSIQLPPDTKIVSAGLPIESFLDDHDLITMLANFKRFCQLVLWCQWYKPLQSACPPVFAISVRLDTGTCVEPNRHAAHLRFWMGFIFTTKLINHIAIIKNIDLDDITINVDIKLLCIDHREMQRGLGSLIQELTSRSTSGGVAARKLSKAITMKIYLFVCNPVPGPGPPASSFRRDVLVRFCSSAEGEMKATAYAFGPIYR